MNVNQKILLQNLGIENLNEMQWETQKSVLKNENTLLLSPTGSGKTIAFLLPILQLLEENIHAVQCLILVPSRELGLQIEQVWKKMGTNFKVNICYGGHSIQTELNNLSNPPAVLIGTPGRIVDHIERDSFSLKEIKTLVLDEFDKSLQLGFHEQMSFIIEKIPSIKKRVLVSATSNLEIPEFTKVENPFELNFIPLEKDNSKLAIKLVESKEKDKIDALFHLICSLESESALIFCNHRESAERTSEILNEKGIFTTFYHGGMEQEERERALIQFRNGSVRYLITTDLASRGLDIPEMNYVIHYHLPAKEEDFTHRNGRTARMLASGTVFILFHSEEKKYDYIEYDSEHYEVYRFSTLPKLPDFKTIYISGGKKNKLNKTDIVGFFSQKGQLQKDDIGIIEVKDFISFVAVKSNRIGHLLEKISNEKMKGKKYKIAVARAVRKQED